MSANYRHLSPEQIRAYHEEQDRRRREFAECLRLFMQNAGLNPCQLAREIGVNRGMVYKWLRGDHLPSDKHLFALEKYFGWLDDD